MSVIRRKSLCNPADHSALRRCLTATDLTLLGIGAIIGAGVFVLTGIAAATKAGPAIVLSYVVSGLACTFTALAYAELASSMGGSGSAYGYAYAGFGEIFAWFIGWALILEYGLSVSAVAIGWSGYFHNILAAMGKPLPAIQMSIPWLAELLHRHDIIFNFNYPATAIVLLITGLLIIGVRESVRINGLMVVIKLLAILLFVIFAIPHVDLAKNWETFAPFGWNGVMDGAALIFFAYIGFDAVSTTADEAVNPARDLPRGILASLAICTVIYIVVSGLLTAIAHYQLLNVDSPVAAALLMHGHSVAASLIAAGAIAGLTTVIIVMFYAVTRILLAMANDGLLPKKLSVVHPQLKTPVTIIVSLGLMIAVVAGFLPMTDLASLVNIGTLAAFVFVCLGVIVSRYRDPHLVRPFRTPASPLIPLLGIIFCVFLMSHLAIMTWVRFFIWQAIGLGIYFLYGYRKSALRQ